jgi:hypothetical protein
MIAYNIYAKNNKEKREKLPFSSKNVLSLYLGGVHFFGSKNPAHMHHFDCEKNMLQTIVATCAAI